MGEEANSTWAQSQIPAGGRLSGRESSPPAGRCILGIETAHPRKHRSPALVCASWSDHGLHTRGSIEGFERISSKQKWLFTHGRKKWETFYGDEALAWQNRFLDHFLRDLDNGMDQVPRVRLEIRKAFYQQGVRSEESWPLPSVQPMRLYLCASTGSLQAEPLSSEGNVRYQSTSRNGKAVFSYRFERPIE
jgi:predicted acyl esterase